MYSSNAREQYGFQNIRKRLHAAILQLVFQCRQCALIRPHIAQVMRPLRSWGIIYFGSKRWFSGPTLANADHMLDKIPSRPSSR